MQQKLKISVLGVCLCVFGCSKPPYNDFHTPSQAVQEAAVGGAVGSTVAAVTSRSWPLGAVIGGSMGGAYGWYKDSPQGLIQTLSEQNVQIVQQGSRVTLIVPADKFFVMGTSELNDLEYEALNNIARLVKASAPSGAIYVAGFTDNIGTKKHQQTLSLEEAQTIASFLWANGVAWDRLKVAGFGESHDIADNTLVHGSAMNRRVEIQWRIVPNKPRFS